MIFKYLIFSKFHHFFKNMIECHFLLKKKRLIFGNNCLFLWTLKYFHVYPPPFFFCIYHILFVLLYGFFSHIYYHLDWFPRWLSGKIKQACNEGDISDPGWSLGCEAPLEEGMATHSSILAWRIPWTEQSGELCIMGSQRVGFDWSDLANMKTERLDIYTLLIFK